MTWLKEKHFCSKKLKWWSIWHVCERSKCWSIWHNPYDEKDPTYEDWISFLTFQKLLADELEVVVLVSFVPLVILILVMLLGLYKSGIQSLVREDLAIMRWLWHSILAWNLRLLLQLIFVTLLRRFGTLLQNCFTS